MKAMLIAALVLLAGLAGAQQIPTSTNSITLSDSIIAADTVADAIHSDTAWSAAFDLTYAAHTSHPTVWKYFYPGIIALSKDSAFTAEHYYVSIILGVRTAPNTYVLTDSLDIDSFTVAAYNKCGTRFRLDSAFVPPVGRFRLIRVDTNEAAIPGLIHQVYQTTATFYSRALEN